MTSASAAWQVRHRALLVVLGAHVPALLGAALLATPGVAPAPAVAPVLAALALAAAPLGRRVRMAAVAIGLLWCSAVFVVASGGAVVAHLHAPATLLVLARYDRALPVVAAALGGMAGYGIGGLAAPGVVFGAAGAGAPGLVTVLAVLVLAMAGLAASGWWPGTETRGARSRAAAALADRERALAEQEHAVAGERAAVEAVKRQLVAVVSHEFRTPLASITGLARTLSARLDRLGPDAVQACLAGIDHHAGRLARLVQNVVAVSGDVEIDRTTATDLTPIARWAVEEASEAHSGRTRVTVDLPPRLEAAIGGEPARSILGNLCDNALKFAPPGSLVEVTGRLCGEQVVVAVANDVCPAAARALEDCFEPFVQGDSSDTRTVEGLGLGLHVARRLAQAHEGDLERRLHGGRVVFEARLPRARRPRPGRGGRDREIRLDEVETPAR